jgi:hypothetical protein
MNIPRRLPLAGGVDPAAWTRVARNPYRTMYNPAPDRHLIPIGLDDDADANVAAFVRLNNLIPTTRSCRPPAQPGDWRWRHELKGLLGQRPLGVAPL